MGLEGPVTLGEEWGQEGMAWGEGGGVRVGFSAEVEAADRLSE